MNDIDELIERLQEWAENEPDLTGYGGKVLKEAITALQEMRQRIAELEKWNTEMVEKAASGGVLEGYREMGAKIERLDAALASVNSLLCIIESQSTSAWDKTQINKTIHEIQKARAGE